MSDKLGGDIPDLFDFSLSTVSPEDNVSSHNSNNTPERNEAPVSFPMSTSYFRNSSHLQSLQRSTSDVTPSYPRTPPASSFVQSPLMERVDSSPISFSLLNAPKITHQLAFTRSEAPKEKYLGTIKLDLEQLLPDEVGPAQILTIHEESPTSLSIHLEGKKLAALPSITSSWLGILLRNGKIRINVKGTTSERDKSLFLFLQVYLILGKLQKSPMDQGEKKAWYYLSEAIGNRRALSSAASAPALGTYHSESVTQGATFPMESLSSRLAKRSETEARIPERETCKTAKHKEGQSVHQILSEVSSQDSLEVFNGGDCMTQRLFDNLNRSANKESEAASSLMCSLRPYQKQALCWLIEREQEGVKKKQKQNLPTNTSNNGLPPNWSECETSCGKKYYYNELTKTTQWEFPMGDVQSKKTKTSIRGGILADEMGMGKTIEMLALILTNTPHLLLRNQQQSISGPHTNHLSEPRSTLVVCPLSVLTQWTKEMEKHSRDNFLSVYVYHGQSRKKEPQFLHDHDVVVTTYATLATELPSEKQYKRTKVKKEKGVLLQVNWLRVILDEAHMIKDRTTRTAKASFQLKSERRWCVTGTPIQNKLDDLFSLLHFLQVEPFCDYNWWNQVIMKPIRNRDEKGFARLQTILQSILLRRTKTQRINNAPIVTLPPRIMKVRKIPFMKEEEDFYKALWDNAKTKFNKYVQVGTVLRNYAHILELLLRLRQACDHPNLVVASRSKNAKEVHKLIERCLKDSPMPSQLSDRLVEVTERCNIADIECLICLESIDTPMITPCGHLFCKECIEREFTNSISDDTKCPFCSYPVVKKNLIPLPSAPAPPIPTGDGSENVTWSTSSKIEALLQELVALWRQDSSVKSIVFSQWTSMLNLVETPLKQLGVSFVRLDGSMSQSNRETAVQSFNNDPNVKVFLISMKAGGLGLNLVSASTVFLLDPWWNPATEQQAIDRVHRLGQRRPVVVTRFIISGTIEERILELQDKKRRLVQGALGRHSKELRKIRLDELRLLFRD